MLFDSGQDFEAGFLGELKVEKEEIRPRESTPVRAYCPCPAR
jgi:hypothetical protein